MSTRSPTASETGDDDLFERAGRWLLAKVWLGCVLSGVYAFTRTVGWPDLVVTLAAALGAVGLAMVALWLPVWTHEYRFGTGLWDVGARVVVWLGLVVAVGSLLLGEPAAGAGAGALLVTTAWRTFGPSHGDAPRRRGRVVGERPTAGAG